MQCPKCGEDDNFIPRTYDSFMQEKIYRMRMCNICGHRYMTEEKIIELKPPKTRRYYGKTQPKTRR